MTNQHKDQGTTLENVTHVVVYRDASTRSKPWHADVKFPDGTVWKGWQSFYSSRRKLVAVAKERMAAAGFDPVIRETNHQTYVERG